MTRLVKLYSAAADPEQAVAQSAYLRNRFTHLGIPTPQRRALSREALEGLPLPEEADCIAVAQRCWELPEREYHYFAVDYLRGHVDRCSAELLPVLRQLIVTHSWWDTVDHLATNVVGPLVAADPALVKAMDKWIRDENLWLNRAALIHQLGYGEATDPERLFSYCSIQARDEDFFIRKAIGWALRQYAKTDPLAVHAYIDRERGRLSPLSVSEARKRGPEPEKAKNRKKRKKS